MSLMQLSDGAAPPRCARGVPRRYAVALAATSAMTLILLFETRLAAFPLIHLMVSVAVSAWHGGLGPGIAATVLGALAADYFFIAPIESIDPHHGLPLVSFLGTGVIISASFETLHRTQRQLQESLDVAEAHRRALSESEANLRQVHKENQRIAEQLLDAERHGRERAEQELRETAEQLRQSQKMEAVGRLAGGVAHDFNNLLTVILSHTGMLLRRHEVTARPELAEGLTEIGLAGERAATLTPQLLAFSRRQVLQPRVVDVNAVVAGVRPMIERLIGEDIQVSFELASTHPRAFCDPRQIEQVLMNLLLNARDAMPRGGRIAITTAWDGHATEPVKITVADNGVGMDEATRERIFEPFFTTKPAGKGTGLGLSMAHGIIEQSGGTITVRSRAGEGAVFEIALPVSTRPVAADEPAGLAPRARGHGETVLLVEDEPQVRALLHGMLEEQGYRVLVAADGRDAWRLVEQHAGRIDVVVTDVVMPGSSGPELVERLAERHPETRAVFVSGYADDTLGKHFQVGADLAFVQKPLTPEAIQEAMRRVLEAPAGRFSARAFRERQRRS
jgi:signal transduction histidine kinase/ActR/RegA family two-component response regulator